MQRCVCVLSAGAARSLARSLAQPPRRAGSRVSRASRRDPRVCAEERVRVRVRRRARQRRSETGHPKARPESGETRELTGAGKHEVRSLSLPRTAGRLTHTHNTGTRTETSSLPLRVLRASHIPSSDGRRARSGKFSFLYLRGENPHARAGGDRARTRGRVAALPARHPACCDDSMSSPARRRVETSSAFPERAHGEGGEKKEREGGIQPPRPLARPRAGRRLPSPRHCARPWPAPRARPHALTSLSLSLHDTPTPPLLTERAARDRAGHQVGRVRVPEVDRQWGRVRPHQADGFCGGPPRHALRGRLLRHRHRTR